MITDPFKKASKGLRRVKPSDQVRQVPVIISYPGAGQETPFTGPTQEEAEKRFKEFCRGLRRV